MSLCVWEFRVKFFKDIGVILINSEDLLFEFENFNVKFVKLASKINSTG